MSDKTTLQLVEDSLNSLTQAHAQFTEYHTAIGYDRESYWQDQYFVNTIKNLRYMLRAHSELNALLDTSVSP